MEVNKSAHLTFLFYSPFQHMIGLHFPVPFEVRSALVICSGQ